MIDAYQLRVLLVDDELPAIAGLRALLSPHRGVAIVGEAHGGRAAIRAIRALEPDLVFLDVQMPEENGFDVLRQVGPEAMPAVIFVTAHDEFAVRAFEVRAIDYLLKPVREDRFASALARVHESIKSRGDLDLARRLRGLLDEHASHAADTGRRAVRDAFAERLIVRVGSRDLIVSTADIDWIEAEDYCAVVHASGKRFLVRDTLGAIEAKLDPRAFTRVHRSAIVSLSRVAELRRHSDGSLEVVLRDGTTLPVSRSRRAGLAAILGSSR
jgi:two-component system LytT family response regulator